MFSTHPQVEPLLRVDRRVLLFGTLALPAVARAAPSRWLRAADYGLRADAGEDGSGTDNAPMLQAILDALASGQFAGVALPRGRYAVGAPIRFAADDFATLTIDGGGAELVFTMPAAAVNRACLAVESPGQTGGRLAIGNLSARLTRPAQRIEGCDMIRLRGFRDYTVESLTIASADNMALTIGRGDRRGRPFLPDSVIVRQCRIGGRSEATPHSHGSIGDSAIWIVTPGRTTEVSRCTIRDAGDDGIYVGESIAPIDSVRIFGNDIRRVGRGVGLSVPNARIFNNRIERTNGPGIGLERLHDNDASHSAIENNTFIAAGQLEAGEIGARMIPKVHPHGIFIYQPGGPLRLSGNIIAMPRESAVAIETHRDGNLADITVTGGRFTGIGGGTAPSPKASVFRRDGAARTTCSRFIARDFVVAASAAPLLRWQASGDRPDSEILVSGARLIGCRLPDSVPLVSLSQRAGGGIENVSIAVELDRSTIARRIDAPAGLRPRLSVVTVAA